MPDNGELNRLVLPDIMTPSQWRDARARASANQPLKQLMLAVLEQALFDCEVLRRTQGKWVSRMSKRDRERKWEAREWCFDSHADGPFSFRGICEALAIDPERLRSRIEPITPLDEKDNA